MVYQRNVVESEILSDKYLRVDRKKVNYFAPAGDKYESIES